MLYGKVLLDEDGEIGNGGGVTLETENAISNHGEEQAANDIFEGDDVFSLKPNESKVSVVDKDKDNLKKLEQEEQERQAIQEEQDKKEAAKAKKATATSEENKEEEAEEEQEQEQQQTAANKNKQRDYTGLPKEDVEILKKQPNNVYALLAPVMKERAKAKEVEATLTKEIETLKKDPNRIPENWFDNDRAIELSPEYEQLASHYDRLSMEGSHWAKQIVRINAGQPYTLLTKWNKETNSYEQTQPQQPPEDVGQKAELIAQLENAKTQAFTRMSAAQQKAETLKATFTAKNKEVGEYYKPIIKDRIETLPAELKPTKEQLQQYYDFVHPAHRNSSQTEVAANLFALCLNQGAVIKKLMAEQGNKKKIQEDQQRAGAPNKGSLAGNSAGKNGKPIIGKDGKVQKDAEVDFDELNKEFGLD